VTFFEILNGRTPFEDYDGEFLDTKEAVEQYWARTVINVRLDIPNMV
jgi:serine/threonine-protein kinase GIN4